MDKWDYLFLGACIVALIACCCIFAYQASNGCPIRSTITISYK